MSTVFEKLLSGEWPCAKVYEDKWVFAFMDAGPLNPGHVLVATREPYETLLDADEAAVAALFATVRRVAHAVQAAFEPDGLTILQANRAAGWQTVPHLHVHVLPRWRHDGVGLVWPRKNPQIEELYEGAKSAGAIGGKLTGAGGGGFFQKGGRLFLWREDRQIRRSNRVGLVREDLKSLPERSRSLVKPMSYAFANKALMMSILVASFLSFDVPFTAGIIIGGFSISYLFLIVSPTPSGIGIVEGIMPLALSSLRVEWSQAVIITLAYRGITFWFSLGVGAIALRILNKEK